MISNKQLFHSETDPVPEIRKDIQIIPIEDDGKQLLYFYDSMRYLPSNFALDASVHPLLQMFNGNLSIRQMLNQTDGKIGRENLIDFVQLLDQHCILHSDYFKFCSDKVEQDFENSETREPVLSGESYPENPEEIKSFVSDLLNMSDVSNGVKGNALYAPHIELSVGKKQYGEAFSHLKNTRPQRVIILATSHYSDYYYRYYEGFPFMGSGKIFKMAGRYISPDLDVINALRENSPGNGFTLKDRAHRIEHSIEFHLLFASVIWQHEFKIVPILISGFDDLFYHETGDLAQKVDRFSKQLKSFIDDDTVVLISGDLSHVGQKFGDREPAKNLREQVEQTDKQFLNISTSGNPDRLLGHIKKDYDSSRICGFAPLYTYLKMFPGKKGELLNYYWWDEKERNSAVSFGSVLY